MDNKLRLLTFYTLVYISASFVFHLYGAMHARRSWPGEIFWQTGWLMLKLPVFVLCFVLLGKSRQN